jgi:hypothetical protein
MREHDMTALENKECQDPAAWAVTHLAVALETFLMRSLVVALHLAEGRAGQVVHLEAKTLK